MNGMLDAGSIAFIAAVVLFNLKKLFDVDRKLAEICTRVKYLERYIKFDDTRERN